jgi:hypothetical protein
MDDTMTLEIGNCVVAIARFSEHAAGDGDGACRVAHRPGVLAGSKGRARYCSAALTLLLREG